MTTQVQSFIVFGIAFVLLYFFYEKNDGKIVLLVSGLFFLFFGVYLIRIAFTIRHLEILTGFYKSKTYIVTERK